MKIRLFISAICLQFAMNAQTDQLTKLQYGYLTGATKGWVLMSFMTVDNEKPYESIQQLSDCVRSYELHFYPNGTYSDIPTKTNCPDQMIERENGTWKHKAINVGHGMEFIIMEDSKIKHNTKMWYVVRISENRLVFAEQGGNNWPNHFFVYKKKE